MAAPRGLHTLARLHGVQTAYRANDGSRVHASPDALMATLRALRVPLDDGAGPAAIADLLRHRRRALAERVVEPVVVSWATGTDAGAGPGAGAGAITVRLPAALREAPVRVAVGLEEGGEVAWEAGGSSKNERSFSGGREVMESFEIDGRGFVVLRLPLPSLPWGYHELTVEAGRGRWSALLIVAPERAAGWDVVADRPAWGLFAPLYALWERGRSAAPDYALLDRLAARIAAKGGSVAATLPVLAAFLDRPCEPSPYAPVSRLFWNELYTDPAAAPGASAAADSDDADDANDAALAAATLAAAEAAADPGTPAGRWLDHAAVMAAKRPALETLARRFFVGGEPPELASFRARNPRVDDYARFRALTERHGIWQDWPDRLRARDVRPGDYDDDAVRYHVYVQWLAERQLAEATERARDRGVSLYLDLPMGVHPAGYDVWRDRALFARGASAGAPPDALGPEGQDWGFPPLHPEASRADRHAYFIACIRKHLRFASVLRLDHVMQLHRMFWVPAGDPTQGVYVRYPAEELYAILCLESRRAGAVIVGEDLGTVPAAVRRGMKRHGLAGMYVAQFEMSEAGDGTSDGEDGEPRIPTPAGKVLVPAPVPRGAVASIGTHDTPTLAGWLHRQDPEVEVELELEVLSRLHDHLARSRAGLVLATMEDLWLEPEPQNVPGTTTDRNWGRRSAEPLEALDAGSPAPLLERLDEARRSSG